MGLNKILIIILLVALGVAIISYTRKIISLKKELKAIKSISIDTDKNKLLSEILKFATKREYDLEQACISIVDTLISFYSIDYCSLLLADESTGQHKIIASTITNIHVRDDIQDFTNSELSHLNKSEGGKVYFCNTGILDYNFCKTRGIRYYFLLPLTINDSVIGSIVIENCSIGNKSAFEEDFFNIVVENISLVLQNLTYHDKLVSMAMRDGLTGAFNRNYLTKTLSYMVEEFSKTNSIFSIVIFDIDHFKKFNDTYGHLFGDLVLKKLVEFMNSNIESDEILCRFGGEEFVLIIPNKSSNEIYSYINKIRENLSSYEISDELTTTSITSSFGIAEFPSNGESVSVLMKNADKALYFSKENGRNQVTSYNTIREV
jgi:two-component system, cell cycle response regulator